MNTTNNGPAHLVKRGEFRTLTGDRKVAILISTGKVELYRVENDGAEIFEGYLTKEDHLYQIGAGSALDRAPVAPAPHRYRVGA
jgi:CRP-like cAMP-binding protein